MINSRIDKRSTYNLITGISYQIISIGSGLLLPRLFITSFGSESNGLLSSVAQIFICLSLLEAGVGTATKQALYKPIAENDTSTINSILSATNAYYKRTGLWYALSISAIAFVYPYLVDSVLSPLTIRCVILLQGCAVIITYLVQAKYNVLLSAEGKSYVLTTITLITLLIRNFGKIISISLGYDVIVVQIVHLLSVLIEASIVLLYIKTKYCWISLSVDPNYKAIDQKNSVLIQSISWMVFNHTDILVLTAFTHNLKLISIYSIFSLLFEAAQNLLNAVRDSFQYKIGKIAQDGGRSLDSYFTYYSIIVLAFTMAVFSSIYLISPLFVSLYTAGVNDTNYLIQGLPELFLFYKMLYGLRALNRQLIEANGHFKQTQIIPMTESILNLSISILLVVNYGIIGVLIGTVAALIVSIIMYYVYIRKHVAPLATSMQLRQIILYIPVMFLILICGRRQLFCANSWIELVFITVLIAIFMLLMYFSVAACLILLRSKVAK